MAVKTRPKAAPGPATKAPANDVGQKAITVQHTLLNGKETTAENVSQDSIEVMPFVGETAKVTIALQVTKSLGDYESAKVFVSVSAPCYVEEIDNMKPQVSELANRYLQEELDSLGLADADDAEEAATEEAEAEEEPGADEGEAETEEAEAEEDDSGEVTPEYIQSLDKKELTALIKENELETDPKDHKTLKSLAAAVIAEVFSEESEDETEEPAAEEEAEEPAAEDAEEEVEPYTEEELRNAKMVDLEEIATEWELDVKVKAGAKLPQKKLAYVKAIMAAQEAAEEETE